MKSRLLVLGAALFAGFWLINLASRGAAAIEQHLDRTFQVAPGGKLLIQADRGSIEVDTKSLGTVHVRVYREAKNATQKQAEELFANHEVVFTQKENTVTVTAQNKSRRFLSWGRQPWLEVRYEVSIPAKFDVDLKTAGGDVSVEPLEGNASARTSSGSIRLPRVSGEVEARNAGGDISIGEAGATVSAQTTSGSIKLARAVSRVELANAGGNINVGEAGADLSAKTTSGTITLGTIRGAVSAANAGGDIRANSVGGELEAQTTSGSVRIGSIKGRTARVKNAGGNILIGDAAGDVSAETTSGSIEIQTAGGRVDAKDAGGNISIGTAGQVVAETMSGSVTVKKANGQVAIRDAGGNIKVSEASGETSLRTSSGSIVTGRIRGNLSAHNAGGDIHIEEAGAAVTAETTSGLLKVAFAVTPRSECRLSVAGGGINVALPGSAAVDLDARAAGGEVTSDLPVSMTVQGRHNSGVLAGKINGGGPGLVLRSSSGNIHVRRSTATPVQVEDESKSKSAAPVQVEDEVKSD